MSNKGDGFTYVTSVRRWEREEGGKEQRKGREGRGGRERERERV